MTPVAMMDTFPEDKRPRLYDPLANPETAGLIQKIPYDGISDRGFVPIPPSSYNPLGDIDHSASPYHIRRETPSEYSHYQPDELSGVDDPFFGVDIEDGVQRTDHFPTDAVVDPADVSTGTNRPLPETSARLENKPGLMTEEEGRLGPGFTKKSRNISPQNGVEEEQTSNNTETPLTPPKAYLDFLKPMASINSEAQDSQGSLDGERASSNLDRGPDVDRDENSPSVWEDPGEQEKPERGSASDVASPYTKRDYAELEADFKPGHCTLPGCKQDRYFTTFASYLSHVRNVHARDILCPEPDCHHGPFANNKDLMRHITSKHGDKSAKQYVCVRPDCPARVKTFSRLDRLQGHNKKYHASATTDEPAESISRDNAKLERRKSTSTSTKSPRKRYRPPSVHDDRPYPKLDQVNTKGDPSHFGMPTSNIQTAAESQPIPLRPRAQTSQRYPLPLDYHAVQPATGGRGPPISSFIYYPSYPIITPTPSYPASTRYTVDARPDYFAPHTAPRPLSSRFDPVDRASSAFDTPSRTTSSLDTRLKSQQYQSDHDYYDDGYTPAAEGITGLKSERRASLRVPSSTSFMTEAEADARAMPPPAWRPDILRRTSEYSVRSKLDPDVGWYNEPDVQEIYHEPRPQRPSTNRNPVTFRLEDITVEQANSGRRQQSSDDQQQLPEPRSSNRHAVSYDLGNVTVEAGTSSRRLQSRYDQPALPGNEYNTKLDLSAKYQEDFEETVPLTAESLKRQPRKLGVTDQRSNLMIGTETITKRQSRLVRVKKRKRQSSP